MSTLIFYIDEIVDHSEEPQNVQLSGECEGTLLEFLSVTPRNGGVTGSLNPEAWVGSVFIPPDKYQELLDCLQQLPIQLVITYIQMSNGRYKVTDVDCHPIRQEGIETQLRAASAQNFKAARCAAQITRSTSKVDKLLRRIAAHHGFERPHHR